MPYSNAQLPVRTDLSESSILQPEFSHRIGLVNDSFGKQSN
jgi:hypothetical protein